jgi:tetratricopeptide (TPR) repeat protein
MLLTNLGNLSTMIHDLENALKYHKDVMDIGSETGDKLAQAIACNNIGNIYLISGDPRTALEYFSKAQTMEHEIGYRILESTSLYNVGITAKTLGQYDQALESLERAVQIMKDIGHRINEAECYALIASVYDCKGDDKNALKYFTRSFKIEEHKNDPFYYMENLIRAAHFHMDRKEMIQAKYYLDAAQKVNDDAGHETFTAYFLPALCEYDLEMGEYRTFEERHEKLRQLGAKLKMESALGSCDLFMGLYCMETGAYEKAGELLHHMYDMVKKQGKQLECGKILLYLGMLAHKQGDKELAREQFIKAVDVFDAIGARGWLVKTRDALLQLEK